MHDQLRCYSSSAQDLYFLHICKKQVFSCCGSNILSVLFFSSINKRHRIRFLLAMDSLHVRFCWFDLLPNMSTANGSCPDGH